MNQVDKLVALALSTSSESEAINCLIKARKHSKSLSTAPSVDNDASNRLNSTIRRYNVLVEKYNTILRTSAVNRLRIIDLEMQLYHIKSTSINKDVLKGIFAVLFFVVVGVVLFVTL